MEYREPTPATRADLEHALAAGDPGAIVEHLLGVVLHEPDGAWVRDLCVGLLGHQRAAVRAAAVTSLGHVARLHPGVSSAESRAALGSVVQSDPDLAGRVEDALDDIRTFSVDAHP